MPYQYRDSHNEGGLKTILFPQWKNDFTIIIYVTSYIFIQALASDSTKSAAFNIYSTPNINMPIRPLHEPNATNCVYFNIFHPKYTYGEKLSVQKSTPCHHNINWPLILWPTSTIPMAKCNIAVSPVLMHWRYHSLALSYWYVVMQLCHCWFSLWQAVSSAPNHFTNQWWF